METFPISLLLAFRVTQVCLECSGIEFRIDSVNLQGCRIDVEIDDSLDLSLVAADAGGVPSPRHTVAVVEGAEGGNHG